MSDVIPRSNNFDSLPDFQLLLRGFWPPPSAFGLLISALVHPRCLTF